LVATAVLVAVILDFNGEPTRYFTYFTVLTNLGIGVWFLGAALTPRWEKASGVRLALTVYGLMTLLVYWIFLAPTHHPQGVTVLANLVLHLIVPLCMAIEDLMVPRPASPLAPVWCLGFPAVYTVFSLVRGLATGWYPYFFFNVQRWQGGWPELTAFLGLLLALFTALAFGWRLIIRRQYRLRAGE
jgi:hypothetical protein